ncbi:NEDD8 ultimate buster 1 [Aplysia californica]|uniref:NEDD8 ultimate buster 1 n=1 Tax=Aplysia californica TaxID=6500 RepID=A0ABM1W467_APLCA|nr:NEDD8 ultimate buster 1 [Aplysia californica]
MDSPGRDLLFTKLRERLNADKIKLWLPPYTQDGSSEKGEVPEMLISQYSEEFKFPQLEVAQALEELRVRALTRLEERAKFQAEGLATLRVKLTCQLPTERSPRKLVPVECSLDIRGSDLKELIAAKFDVPQSLLKLICRGRVIADEKTLSNQGVKNGSDLMAMCMTVSEANVIQKDSEFAQVKRTRRAAELLSNRGDDDEHFDVQIADQKGQPINLPKDEKKALTVAMTLHEKGRSALKEKKVTLALPLLLEADEEFSKCRAEILKTVDNYAILCLDVVWCYFLLKNLEQLPDAESRLHKSEECFKLSYGEQMERLTAIKGGTGTEQALFMRLYLLQGIVAFHQGQLSQARNLLGRAQFVLSLLHVDPDKLNEVMLMGFTEREARLGLRAKNGNIQQAVDHIMKQKQEKEEINQRVKKEWKQRVRAKKLGKTRSGQLVNMEHYDTLVAMEFSRGAAAEALKQADNNFDAALEVLNQQPQLRLLPDPEKQPMQITEASLEQVVAMGFPLEMARQALENSNGDLLRTINLMLERAGSLAASTTAHSAVSSGSSTSNSSSTSSSSSCSTETPEEKKERLRKEKEELDSLVQDINRDENDHLDLTLTEEREALGVYQGLLDSVAV